MSATARTTNALAAVITATLTYGGLGAAVPAQAAAAPALTASSAAAAIGSSTSLALSDSKVEFGAPVTVTAKVTTTSGTPAGTVAFVVDGVSTTVPLEAGVAALEVTRTRTGTATVSAVFTPDDLAAYDGSSAAPTRFTVVKADTTTGVRILGKRLQERTSATVRATGFHGTVPRGKVKLVLREVGERGIVTARRGRLGTGSRGFNFGRLEQGAYKITVKYLGDPNHRRSQKVKRFRVRP